jgi:hypothetical protein
MADTVARSIDQGNHPTLLVVGRFHVDHHGGLVQALDQLSPNSHSIIVSFADEPAPKVLPTKDSDRADFIIYVGKAR